MFYDPSSPLKYKIQIAPTIPTQAYKYVLLFSKLPSFFSLQTGFVFLTNKFIYSFKKLFFLNLFKRCINFEFFRQNVYSCPIHIMLSMNTFHFNTKLVYRLYTYSILYHNYKTIFNALIRNNHNLGVLFDNCGRRYFKSFLSLLEQAKFKWSLLIRNNGQTFSRFAYTRRR